MDAADQSPEGYTFKLSVENTTSGAAQDSGFTLPTPATATSDKVGDINFKPITFNRGRNIRDHDSGADSEIRGSEL